MVDIPTLNDRLLTAAGCLEFNGSDDSAPIEAINWIHKLRVTNADLERKLKNAEAQLGAEVYKVPEGCSVYVDKKQTELIITLERKLKEMTNLARLNPKAPGHNEAINLVLRGPDSGGNVLAKGGQ